MSRSSRRRSDPPTREPLDVVANYRPSPLGGWIATVTATGLDPRQHHKSDAHEAFHAVLDELAVIADEARRPLATVHELDGDPAGWAALAEREGFAAYGTHEGHHSRFVS